MGTILSGRITNHPIICSTQFRLRSHSTCFPLYKPPAYPGGVRNLRTPEGRRRCISNGSRRDGSVLPANPRARSGGVNRRPASLDPINHWKNFSKRAAGVGRLPGYKSASCRVLAYSASILLLQGEVRCTGQEPAQGRQQSCRGATGSGGSNDRSGGRSHHTRHEASVCNQP